MKNIFIIGSKGIPARYGGFETFVDKLTELNEDYQSIRYHVACLGVEEDFIYNGARCFGVKVPKVGSAEALLYDLKALDSVYSYIKQNKIERPIIYILACRIGPFLNFYKRKLNKFNAKILINPDGHEFKRDKWNLFIKWYWKFSEKLMVKHTDLVICDSKNIKKYIESEYNEYKPVCKYISYGTEIKEISKDIKELNKYNEWLNKFNLKEKEYYLIVGRFVPENNYLTMIKEFMSSETQRKLVIITNVEENKFYSSLLKETNFNTDSRILFVGTVYDQSLLNDIRINAFAYIHGHEVGGTNPSLLEALGATSMNLLLDVGFNREVAENSAIYWKKEKGSLSSQIKYIEKLNEETLANFGFQAKERIRKKYSWEIIGEKYIELFLNDNKDY